MKDPWEDEYEDEDDEELNEQEEQRSRIIRRRQMARLANDARGNWYLLTGLLIGLAIGLLVAWVISPVKYMDADPGLLSANHKDEYRQVIALAYTADQNLDRARERIKLIDAGSGIQALASQAQRLLSENQPPQDARSLAVLAADLGRESGQVNAKAPTALSAAGKATAAVPASGTAPTATQAAVAAIQTPTVPPPPPTATRTPMPTFTPRPTATPLRFLDSPFTLKSKQELCESSAKPGLLLIEVMDANGKPLPGVRISATWQAGQDTFYTGLAPEVDPGYADFVMAPGAVYSLMVGEASKPVSGLGIPSCGGGLKLEFQQGN